MKDSREQVLVDSMAELNVQIIPNADYEFFEKEINKIDLGNKHDGELTFSNAQKPTIETIAFLCPLAGGPAVFRARAMMLSYNDSIVFNDDSLCAAQGYAYKLALEVEDSTIERVYDQVLVFPNPTNGIFNVYTGTSTAGEMKKILVYNVQGQLVMNTFGAQNKFTLDFSNDLLSSGLYLVEVYFKDTGRVEHKKILYAR